MRTDTTPQPTAAEAFAAIDQRFTDLQARRDLASDHLGQLRNDVDKAHGVYRSSLARAEIDGTAAPSRAELDAKERELLVAEDKLGGLEEAVTTLKPDWKSAKRATVRAEQETIGRELQALQQQDGADEIEIKTVQERIGVRGQDRQRLITRHQQLETEVLALLRNGRN